MSQGFNNNINSFNVANNLTVADDRSEILAWISPLEPGLRHQDVRDGRIENVGEWLLQTEEFKSWCNGSGKDESDNAVLFCYGNTGVGKTYISSLVIDNLCDQAGGQDAAVACFYLDFAVRKEQSPTRILGALLKQIVSGLEEIPEEIVQAFQAQKKVIGGRRLRLPDILKMLQTASASQRTFICLDALDECVPEYLVKILDSIKQILQMSPSTRVFLTGRPHIRGDIEKRLAGRTVVVPICPSKDDIIRYVRSKLDEDTTPDAMDGSLEAEIVKKIPDDISEIFLLVSLNIEAILRETTIHRRRQKLSAMSGGLGLVDVYGTTLGRIKGQGEEKSRLGMAALMWISHSERPLKVEELCHALAVERGSPNLNNHNVPSIGTLLACCQGLITMDKEASTVRLIHFTLQEYLRSLPDLFIGAHSTIAETCLSYLNSQQVRALSASPSPDLWDIPFLNYSSLYWGIHAKRNLSQCAKSLALELFDEYDNHISAKLLLEEHMLFVDPDYYETFSPFTGLHCASLFGIVEIATTLIEKKSCDIDQCDFMGKTPLIWAASNGHESLVKILLEQEEVDPDQLDDNENTSLWLAAYNGYEGVVKMLLEREEVNPNQPNEYDETPLCCAALNGHEGVVKMLLEREEVNPDQPNINRESPLWCAASNGHEGVVKMLLEQEVNPDRPDGWGRTPLCRAACNGHEGVAKMLLEQEVNPDKPDIWGRTPLWRAAHNGHEGVAKILLEREDVNPDQPDDFGETPLWCATQNGHTAVVALLQPQNLPPPTRSKAESVSHSVSPIEISCVPHPPQSHKYGYF